MHFATLLFTLQISAASAGEVCCTFDCLEKAGKALAPIEARFTTIDDRRIALMEQMLGTLAEAKYAAREAVETCERGACSALVVQGDAAWLQTQEARKRSLMQSDAKLVVEYNALMLRFAPLIDEIEKWRAATEPMLKVCRIKVSSDYLHAQWKVSDILLRQARQNMTTTMGMPAKQFLAGTPIPVVAPTAAPSADAEGVGYLDLRHGEASCSGTLVDPQWVLTAAHCLRDASAPAVRFALSRRDGGPAKYVVADRLSIHPGFFRRYGEGTETDVALVHLVTPLAGGSVVPLGGRQPVAARSAAIAVGFGFDRQGTLGAKHAKHILVNVDFPRGGKLAPGVFFLMPGAEAEIACEGDSGGPLLQYRAGKRVVIGVLSSLVARKTFLRRAEQASTKEGGRFLCRNAEAGIATSIAVISDWLESSLNGRQTAREKNSLSLRNLRGSK